MWDALPCCDGKQMSSTFALRIHVLTLCVDKYIIDNDRTLAVTTRDNTIMWNMARGEVSFVVWLYSIVIIRDGMKGDFNSAETRLWYNEALRKIRQELANQVRHGKFSDQLVTALACIQATSVSVRSFSLSTCSAGKTHTYPL